MDLSPTATLSEKKLLLIRNLKGFKSLLVAFSGGVDSSFLLACALEALGSRVTAVTADSVTFSKREKAEALSLARTLGVAHLLISSDELKVPEFLENTPDRCYFCKKALGEKLLALAAEKGIAAVAFGANTDDLGDYRPGTRAAQELGIFSPLVDAGLSKAEIRFLAREMGLSVWDKPSMACLSSRIPYGTNITPEKLSAVEEAEDILFGLGLAQVRVRYHDLLARIEVTEADFPRFSDPAFRKTVSEQFKAIGFKYISLDLEGYISGSMNRVLSL